MDVGGGVSTGWVLKRATQGLVHAGKLPYWDFGGDGGGDESGKGVGFWDETWLCVMGRERDGRSRISTFQRWHSGGGTVDKRNYLGGVPILHRVSTPCYVW